MEDNVKSFSVFTLLGWALFLGTVGLTIAVISAMGDDYTAVDKYTVALIGAAAQGIGLVVAAFGKHLSRD